MEIQEVILVWHNKLTEHCQIHLDRVRAVPFGTVRYMTPIIHQFSCCKRMQAWEPELYQPHSILLPEEQQAARKVTNELVQGILQQFIICHIGGSKRAALNGKNMVVGMILILKIQQQSFKRLQHPDPEVKSNWINVSENELSESQHLRAVFRIRIRNTAGKTSGPYLPFIVFVWLSIWFYTQQKQVGRYGTGT